jgi:hypothetical protein
MHNAPTQLSMSRSQLKEQICQTSKSDRQEWQSLVVLNGTNIFLKGTNISFLKFICGILYRGVANSFWNHVIQMSSIQMYFQDIYSNLWKVKLFSGNIYSLKSNTFFWGTVMFVQDGYLNRYHVKLNCSSTILTKSRAWPGFWVYSLSALPLWHHTAGRARDEKQTAVGLDADAGRRAGGGPRQAVDHVAAVDHATLSLHSPAFAESPTKVSWIIKSSGSFVQYYM